MAHENCPFCKTQINEGAIVCHACNAFKNRRRVTYNAGSGFSLLVSMVAWFIFGPCLLLIGTLGFFKGESFSTCIFIVAISGSITYYGKKFLNKWVKNGDELIWMRKS